MGNPQHQHGVHRYRPRRLRLFDAATATRHAGYRAWLDAHLAGRGSDPRARARRGRPLGPRRPEGQAALLRHLRALWARGPYRAGLTRRWRRAGFLADAATIGGRSRQ